MAGHVLDVLFQVLCAGHGPYRGLTSPLKSGFLQLRVIHLVIYLIFSSQWVLHGFGSCEIPRGSP